MRWEDKPRSEIERSFVEGFERLVRACGAFDAGHASEAPNIAKEVMTFVYDHGAIRSILTHLDLRDRIQFSDSSKPSILDNAPLGFRSVFDDYRLVNHSIGFMGMRFDPILGSKGEPRLVPFGDWWSGTVLSRYAAAPPSQERESITRGEILEHIRNEEGGGHVAARYKRGTPADKLARLMQGEYVNGYMTLDSGPPVTAEAHAPVYATLRQIGWELVKTLRRIAPELVSQACFHPSAGPRMRPVSPDRL